ncbi:MAG: ABC transporter permease [Nitrososphaerales archaeon]
MTFWRFVVRRAVFSAVVVLVVVILTFGLIRLAPGDPAELLAGEAASPEYVKRVREDYGLDRPIYEQLIIYLSGIIRGDLGFSISFSRPVLDVILERLPQTMLLVGSAITIALVVGILLGILSARRAFKVQDTVITAVTLTLYSTPVFWLGMMLILLFSLWIPIFPTGGYFDVGVEKNLTEFILNVSWHLILPACTLSVFFLALYTRLTRAGLLDALSSNYIIGARAKGVPERILLYKHALKNALLPIVTVAAIQIGLMVGGVVLTEGVFSWPGVGQLLIQAVGYRDYMLVTGIFLITAVSVSIANFAADIIYAIIDPRIRTG